MNNDEFPRLHQFLGAYFHEDWMCESESADDIIRLYLSDSSDSAICSVKQEIAELSRLQISENELQDFLLKEIGCSYCYWHEWPSGKAWLSHILCLLGGKV